MLRFETLRRQAETRVTDLLRQAARSRTAIGRTAGVLAMPLFAATLIGLATRWLLNLIFSWGHGNLALGAEIVGYTLIFTLTVGFVASRRAGQGRNRYTTYIRPMALLRSAVSVNMTLGAVYFYTELVQLLPERHPEAVLSMAALVGFAWWVCSDGLLRDIYRWRRVEFPDPHVLAVQAFLLGVSTAGVIVLAVLIGTTLALLGLPALLVWPLQQTVTLYLLTLAALVSAETL